MAVWNENGHGDLIDYESAVALMDDDIREEMHAEGTWDAPQAFLAEYARRHLERYQEDFQPWISGRW